MYIFRNLNILPPGTGSRWALGVIVLTHLIVYDESGGPGAVIGITISAISSIFYGKYINIDNTLLHFFKLNYF